MSGAQACMWSQTRAGVRQGAEIKKEKTPFVMILKTISTARCSGISCMASQYLRQRGQVFVNRHS